MTVNVGAAAVIDFHLKPGSINGTIEIKADASQLQTQDASVGQVIDWRSVNNLPLNGRNYTFLAQLASGVNSAQANARSDALGNAATGAFAANGLRPAQNNYLLDGVDNNSNVVDFLNGTNCVVLPPVDAIQELSVQTTDDVFGFAVHPLLASVYYDRVLIRAVRDAAQFEVHFILGAVMAHEIGHFAYRLEHAHSGSGVMQACWHRKQIRQAVTGTLFFTAEQARLIQAETETRANLATDGDKMSSPIALRAFDPDEYRKFVQTLSDEELVTEGKTNRRPSDGKIVSVTVSMFDEQLKICREEYRRRHPKISNAG